MCVLVCFSIAAESCAKEEAAVIKTSTIKEKPPLKHGKRHIGKNTKQMSSNQDATQFRIPVHESHGSKRFYAPKRYIKSATDMIPGCKEEFQVGNQLGSAIHMVLLWEVWKLPEWGEWILSPWCQRATEVRQCVPNKKALRACCAKP